MTLQIFLTLLVIGAVLGSIATLVGKGAKKSLPINLLAATAGLFLGWFLFTQISRFALQITFAIGAGLLALWLVTAIKK